jgi:hypothetical protein
MSHDHNGEICSYSVLWWEVACKTIDTTLQQARFKEVGAIAIDSKKMRDDILIAARDQRNYYDVDISESFLIDTITILVRDIVSKLENFDSWRVEEDMLKLDDPCPDATTIIVNHNISHC